MAEPKPFASLTSSLLARKGGARPAMRRQLALGEESHGQDDLGWNDMGDSDQYYRDPMAVAGLTPMPYAGTPSPEPVEQQSVPHVIEERRELAEKVTQPVAPEPAPVVKAPAVKAPVVEAPVATAPEPRRVSAPRAAAVARKAKAAFTLRLDPERHLRLRLACAVGNRSAQQIVTAALDAFLDGQPDIEALADQVGRDGGAH
ncbi:MAG: hypothetical protein DI547_02710 [Sphingobium sp.]|nr:MAG: hypothetical protein DI547_02710 [Sphingobium sp.]